MPPERRYLNLNAYLRNSGYHEAAWRARPPTRPACWNQPTTSSWRGRPNAACSTRSSCLTAPGWPNCAPSTCRRRAGPAAAALLGGHRHRAGRADRHRVHHLQLPVGRGPAPGHAGLPQPRTGAGTSSPPPSPPPRATSATSRTPRPRTGTTGPRIRRGRARALGRLGDDAAVRSRPTGQWPTRPGCTRPATTASTSTWPAICRSPLAAGPPVPDQAGSSPPGVALAARYADAVFAPAADIAAGVAFRQKLRAQAAGYGRDPDQVRILPACPSSSRAPRPRPPR